MWTRLVQSSLPSTHSEDIYNWKESCVGLFKRQQIFMQNKFNIEVRASNTDGKQRQILRKPLKFIVVIHYNSD